MTPREAVEFLLEGYGDDCPEGGDRFIEAILALADAGLTDVRDGQFVCTWPLPPRSPQFAPPQWLVESYVEYLNGV